MYYILLYSAFYILGTILHCGMIKLFNRIKIHDKQNFKLNKLLKNNNETNVTFPYTMYYKSHSHAEDIVSKYKDKDNGFNIISYKEKIWTNGSLDKLNFAGDILLGLKYFPDHIIPKIIKLSPNKYLDIGDRFIQTVYLKGLGLDIACVDVVSQIYREPNRIGVTVTTTDIHDEVGEHSAWVIMLEDQSIWLEVIAISYFKIISILKYYAQYLQVLAHNSAKNSIISQCNERYPLIDHSFDTNMSDHLFVVTGSSGFIGSRLVKHLLKNGAKVIGVDLNRSAEIINDNYIQFKTDISDVDQMTTTFNKINILNVSKNKIIIVHLAAYWDYELDDPYDKYYPNNIQGTQNVLKIAKQKLDKIDQIIFISSLAIYDFLQLNSDTIITEKSTDKLTNTPYGISKINGEKICFDFATNNPGTKVHIVRLAGVYNDWSQLPVLTEMVENFSKAIPFINRFLPGSNRDFQSGMPFIHLDSVVGLLTRIITKYERLKQYDIFIGGSSTVKYNDICRKITNKNVILVPKILAKYYIYFLQFWKKTFSNKKSITRPYMIDSFDHIMICDQSYTNNVLELDLCAHNIHLLDRIDIICENFKNKSKWLQMNAKRIDHLK